MNAHAGDRPPPYAAVVFDCDSTLSAIEGIDELADAAARAEIEALTARAMAGEASLEDVYGERLAIIRPRRDDVVGLAEAYVEHQLEGARETVQALKRAGKAVAVISGGLLDAVQPFAESLGVSTDLVFAVGLEFDADGEYVDFERDSPLVRADGKPELTRELTSRFGPLAMIGDGSTDLACQATVARFIGFGGVVRRPNVEARAHHFVHEPDLRALLPLLLTESERARA